MLKQLSIVGIAAASVAAVIAVFTWPGEAQQRTSRAPISGEATMSAPIHVVNNSVRYDAGMRIIHVPQPGEVANDPVTTESVTDEEIALPPKHKRVVMPVLPQPKRVLPPSGSGPKRSVLSAPTPLADGPTPIRPLPRWRSSEKFTAPSPIVADPVPADAVTATIPDESSTSSVDPPDMPAIDDDTPPPTD